MIDTGLLASILIVAAGLHLFARWSPPTLIDRPALSELWVGPVLLGLVLARVVFVAFDDPTSLASVRDLLVFRSGLEFWAGAAVAVAGVTWKARHLQPGPLAVLGASMPFGLFGVALYEAGCVVRDGCFGPPSGLGLVPPGLERRMLPLGLFVCATLLAVGALLKRLWLLSPSFAVAISGLSLAGTRAVASRGLPSIGPSRIQVESDVVAAVSAIAVIALSIRWVRVERRGNASLNAAASSPVSGANTL